MRRRWERLLLATAIGVGPVGAFAQDQRPPPAEEDSARTIVVTGTRIRRAGEDRPTPTQVVRPEEFTLTGVPNVEQTLNQLPQLVAGFTNTSNNPGTGGATLDLRGLGSVRTLILVNGRRWIASDAGQIPEVDVNTIPAALIERVDIVTGGASAVYGSDAVTGVINFILRDNLEGVSLEARQNITENGDGRVSSADLSFGTGFASGRGRILGSIGWLDQSEVLQGDRTFSRVTLNDGCAQPGTRANTGASLPANDPACAPPNVLAFTAGGSAFIPGSRIVGRALFPVPGGNALAPSFPGLRFDPDGSPRPFNPATDLYNTAPPNYLQVPFRRWSGNILASIELVDGVEPYTELTYVRTESDQQLAPIAGLLGGGTGSVPVARINLANPFLTPDAARVLELSYGVDAFGRLAFTASPATGFRVNPAFTGDADGIVNLPILLQTRLDLGPRKIRNTREAYRTLIGVRGDLDSAWSYDAYFSRSQVRHDTDYRNSGSAGRLQQALLAVRDPASGLPACIDPSNGCVPANIFGEGNLSAAAADFIRTNPKDVTTIGEQVAEASLRGELGLLSRGPTGVAAGVTWRRSDYSFVPDASLFTGDILGFMPGTPAAGNTSVGEVFAEVRAPLLADLPLVRALVVEAGLRWSHYDTSGSAWTWKALAEWTLLPQLKFRGGYQRAVRAPNVRELYEQPVEANGSDLDPCSVSTGFLSDPAVIAACLRNGVPAERLGTELAASPVLTTRGNPDLDPETAHTLTAGAILSAAPLVDLTLTADYYEIRIDRPIGVFGGGPFPVLLGCILSGADPIDPLCSAYRRGGDGTLLSIDLPTSNLHRLVARGIDWQLAYRTVLGGRSGGTPNHLSLQLSGTRYFENRLQTSANLPSVDCAGLFGGTCGNTITRTATPRWKLYNNLVWSAGATSVSLRHRWFSATEDSRAAQRVSRGLPPEAFPEEGRRLESRHYFDLGFTIRANDAFVFTAGVNNLTNRSPAITGLNQVQANTDPSLYDVLGRRFFVTISTTLR